jgi:triacylglycerol lipase
MIARTLTLLIALIGALVLGGAAWLALRGDTEWAIALLMAPVALLVASFTVEGIWLHTRNASDPAPRARVGDVVRALFEEARISMPLFLWHQARSAAGGIEHLDAQRHRGQTPVLLIHGYFCNAAFWHRWGDRLRAEDRPFAAITLEPAFGSIDRMAPVIEAALQRLICATGQPAVIVAHSMGGLATRAWWRQASPEPQARIRHVITLGTPHQGTAVARWSHTTNGRQMRERNSWLTALAAAEPADRASQFTCFYSHCDNIVFPASNATLPGADNRHVPATAHIALADRPEPWAELQRWLRPQAQPDSRSEPARRLQAVAAAAGSAAAPEIFNRP